MPRTAETSAGEDETPRRPGPIGMPDRDNPFAWRAKAKEGRAGAIHLLKSLTDDEVRRYMAVARDQVKLEERRAALKMLLVVCSLAVGAAVTYDGVTSGFTRWHFGGLGLALALGYWPWRVYACRRLWLKHFNAAKAELAQRQAHV